MTTILYTRCNTLVNEEILRAWCSYLSPVCRSRIEKLQRPRDRQASILGRILVMVGLSGVGIAADTIKNIGYTSHHRPYIPAPVDFNISHSGSVIVCALSTTRRVGIDIEEIKPILIDDFRAHMSAEEYEHISNADDRHLAFYQYWAKTESVIKADGRGFFVPLKQLKWENDKASLEQKIWYTKLLYIVHGYAACIATNKVLEEHMPVMNIDFEKLSPDDYKQDDILNNCPFIY